MDCAIRTDDAMVSRHHSRIFWGGGGYVLEDLSSANGVYFQEQRVQNHLFKHGDAVRCGSLWLRFVDTGAAAVPGAPQGGQMPGGQMPMGGAAPMGGGGAPMSMGGPQPQAAPQAAPMMQHPGMGAIAPAGPTGHINAVPAGLIGGGPAPAPTGLGGGPIGGPSEADVEIRVLRRRVEQLQTELRVYRGGKFNAETARKMEDLEADLQAMEIERDSLKTKLARTEEQMTLEAGSVKVKRAIEIASATAEASSALNDVLSSLRIEVMAAEGEFEQFSHTLPRTSFELIRQSLKDAASHCDEARDMLRKLREVAS
jgi:hypothetical protein